MAERTFWPEIGNFRHLQGNKDNGWMSMILKILFTFGLRFQISHSPFSHWQDERLGQN
jgi:hypothetical protein